MQMLRDNQIKWYHMVLKTDQDSLPINMRILSKQPPHPNNTNSRSGGSSSKLVAGQ